MLGIGCGLVGGEGGTAKLFSADATGLIVRLPDGYYPVVIDTFAGVIR
jgi:hypothetical protein